MSFFYYIELIAAFVAIACMALGIILLMKRYHSRQGRFLSLFIIFMSLWILSVYFADISTNLSSLVFWTKLAAFFALCFITTFNVFAYLFRSPHSIRGYLWFFIPVLPVMVLVLAFPNDKVYVENPFINFSFDRPVGGLLNEYYYLYVLMILAYYLIGFYVILRKRKELPPHTRNQIRYITLGCSISMAGGIVFDGILPVLGIDYLYALGPTLSLFLVAFTIYAIIRHQLFDLRIVFQRSLIFTFLLVFIIAFYLGLVLLVGTLLQKITHTTMIFSAGLTTLAGIFAAPPLERYFRRITDKFFFKDKYDYPEAMHQLSEILNKNLELTELVSELSQALNKILRTRGVVFDFDGRKIPSDGGLSIPITFETEAIAILRVEPKLSGDEFTAQDRRLVGTFANQAAVSLKKAELYKQVRDYSLELEDRVDERTRQLQNLQEEQKRMMLDISHGLQTPLTVFKSELEALKSAHPKETRMQVLEKSVDRVAQFVYGLLRLARLETLESKSQAQSVNFSGIAEEVLEYVDTICREQGIKVEKTIQPGLMVLGEKDRINELITNLLSNAIKHASISKVKTIWVALAQKSGFAEFSVTDSGRGITEDDLPNIFKRFYKSANPGVQGTGLGLAICKTIVEMSGGEISVANRPGGGASFLVRLPLI